MIEPYCRRKRLDFDEVLFDLRAMDKTYLDMISERREAERSRQERVRQGAEMRAKFRGGR